MIIEIAAWITSVILKLNYFGIVLLLAIESSFIPLPSELIMIPAGYLVFKGYFNIYVVIICGTIGSILGALFNYWLADKYGRQFIHKNAKYLFTTKEKLEKIEKFFLRHSAFSTFFGRLIFGVRHYISFPAGLAKMDIKKFILYTGLGAFIWVSILTYLGYKLGQNLDLAKTYLHQVTIYMVLAILLIGIIYFSIIYRMYISDFIHRMHKKITKKEQKPAKTL